ncbi:putative uncharacterized protein FLJ46204 [Meleagris gallopavo]|uniref:putative uncharacterized protein FLJ46204 n=1 Tax=Meleagris gallopavo TaxID=9103 RepID=UPI00093C5BA7|nr:putative uncharacterized protein FLJ46204 [Meleagris gallopavo]
MWAPICHHPSAPCALRRRAAAVQTHTHTLHRHRPLHAHLAPTHLRAPRQMHTCLAPTRASSHHHPLPRSFITSRWRFSRSPLARSTRTTATLYTLTAEQQRHLHTPHSQQGPLHTHPLHTPHHTFPCTLITTPSFAHSLPTIRLIPLYSRLLARSLSTIRALCTLTRTLTSHHQLTLHTHSHHQIHLHTYPFAHSIPTTSPRTLTALHTHLSKLTPICTLTPPFEPFAHLHPCTLTSHPTSLCTLRPCTLTPHYQGPLHTHPLAHSAPPLELFAHLTPCTLTPTIGALCTLDSLHTHPHH